MILILIKQNLRYTRNFSVKKVTLKKSCVAQHGDLLERLFYIDIYRHGFILLLLLLLLLNCFSEPKLVKMALILIKWNLRYTLNFSVTPYFEKILCSEARRFIRGDILPRYLQPFFCTIVIVVVIFTQCFCCSSCLTKTQNFRKNRNIKGVLSGLRHILATEAPLKMMKSAFYFTSKSSFHSQDI